MEYKMKFGTLKGMTPEEAYNSGAIEELLRIKASLLKNFSDDKYVKYKEGNLEGYLAIEQVILTHYQPLLNEFNDLYSKLSEDDKKEFHNEIDKNIFYNNDIVELQKIVDKLKNK